MNALSATEWQDMDAYWVWMRGKNLGSRTIQAFDDVIHFGQRYNSVFNHVALEFCPRAAPSIAWESRLKYGVGITPAEHYRSSKNVTHFYRHKIHEPQEKINRLYKECVALECKKYDKLHIALLTVYLMRDSRDLVKEPPKYLDAARNKKFTCGEAVHSSCFKASIKYPKKEMSEVVDVIQTPHRLFYNIMGIPSKLAFPRLPPYRGKPIELLLKDISYPMT